MPQSTPIPVIAHRTPVTNPAKNTPILRHPSSKIPPILLQNNHLQTRTTPHPPPQVLRHHHDVLSWKDARAKSLDRAGNPRPRGHLSAPPAALIKRTYSCPYALPCITKQTTSMIGS